VNKLSEDKKYYYLKLKEDFFDEPELKVIEGLPNGHKYSNILLKMYLRSLKREGKLMITDCIPFEVNSLASVVGHDVDTVRAAIDLFVNFKLIERLDSGEIYMTQIQQFIGKTTTEADRKRAYRARIEAEKLAKQLGLLPTDQPVDQLPELPVPPDQPTEPPQPPTIPNCPYEQIKALYEEHCPKFPQVRELTDKRKKVMLTVWKKHTDITYFKEVFIRAGASKFMAGDNDRNWVADFDFLINQNNIVKILEGKYDNKGKKNESTKQHNALDLLAQRRAERNDNLDGRTG